MVNTSGLPPRKGVLSPVGSSFPNGTTPTPPNAFGTFLPPGREIREVQERTLASGLVVRVERSTVTYFDPTRGVYVSAVEVRLPAVSQGRAACNVEEVRECRQCLKVLGPGAAVTCAKCGDDCCRADSRELVLEGGVVVLCSPCVQLVTTPKVVRALMTLGRGAKGLLWGRS